MNRNFEQGFDADHPTLAELVRDPLVRLVMRSDGVEGRSIEALFEQIARHRRREPRPRGGAAARR